MDNEIRSSEVNPPEAVKNPIEAIKGNLNDLISNLKTAESLKVDGASRLLAIIQDAKKEIPQLFPEEPTATLMDHNSDEHTEYAQPTTYIEATRAPSAIINQSARGRDKPNEQPAEKVLLTREGNPLNEVDSAIVSYCNKTIESLRAEQEQLGEAFWGSEREDQINAYIFLKDIRRGIYNVADALASGSEEKVAYAKAELARFQDNLRLYAPQHLVAIGINESPEETVLKVRKINQEKQIEEEERRRKESKNKGNRERFQVLVDEANIKPIDGVWKQIVIDEQIGAGAFSSVRKAIINGGIERLKGGFSTLSEDVVIKIPKPVSPETATDRDRKNANDLVMHEGQVLQLLREKHGELFPERQPFCVDSVLVTQPNGEVALVMEELPQQNGIFRIADNPSTTNQDLYTALTQYFEMIATAYELGIVVADRKEGDIYYFPETKRLVVTDWNVTNQNDSAEGSTGGLLSSMHRGLDFFRDLDKMMDKTGKGFSPEMKQKIRILAEGLKSKKESTTPIDIAGLIKNLPYINEGEIGLRL